GSTPSSPPATAASTAAPPTPRPGTGGTSPSACARCCVATASPRMRTRTSPSSAAMRPTPPAAHAPLPRPWTWPRSRHCSVQLRPERWWSGHLVGRGGPRPAPLEHPAAVTTGAHPGRAGLGGGFPCRSRGRLRLDRGHELLDPPVGAHALRHLEGRGG